MENMSYKVESMTLESNKHYVLNIQMYNNTFLYLLENN